MRCSWFESKLDRFIEGTLAPRQMRTVRDHLASCSSCTALVHELRVVDALLATTTSPSLAPNFTFAVMAELRAMPAPRSRVHAIWPALAFYLVATWVVIAGALAAFGNSVSAAGALANSLRTSLAHAGGAVSGAAHALGPATPAVIGVVGGVLAIDVILVACIVIFYHAVRPRLTARLARSEAS